MPSMIMTFFQNKSLFLNCHFVISQSPLTQSHCKGDSETLPAIAQTDEPCQCHCFTLKVSCWPWGVLGPILTTNLPIGIFLRTLWLPPRASVVVNLLKSADRISRVCFIPEIWRFEDRRCIFWTHCFQEDTKEHRLGRDPNHFLFPLHPYPWHWPHAKLTAAQGAERVNYK